MSFWHPALRSRRFGHRALRAGHIIKIGVFTWLAPSLLGVLIIALSYAGYEASNFDNPWTIVGAVGGIMLLAPVYGIVLVPMGLLLGAWAMRFGVAGWLSALGASIVLPLAIGATFQVGDPTLQIAAAGIAFVPVSVAHALAMWISTRWLCPEALLSELP